MGVVKQVVVAGLLIVVTLYCFYGRYDYNTPFELADRHYRVLDAPRGKHFIGLENAAQMIPYQAPDEYADALIRRVLKQTRESEMRTAERREPEPIRPQPGAAAAPTAEDLASATYPGIYAEPVTLRDGEWEGEPFAEGGASRPRVTLARDFRLTGDLDGDENHEAVVVLVETSGGSGTNQYLAAVGWRDLDVFPLATALVGDRVQIRSGRIANRRIELEVVQAGPEDAACCPSQNARRVWALEGEGLEEISTEITGSLSLADLEGVEWVLTHFGREEPAPIRPEVTLRVDALRWSGSGGCNRYFTNVALGDAPGDVAVGPIGASRMACTPEQMEVEGRYLEALGRVSRFGFLTGRLFLTWSDDGAVQTLLFAPRSSEGGRQ